MYLPHVRHWAELSLYIVLLEACRILLVKWPYLQFTDWKICQGAV